MRKILFLFLSVLLWEYVPAFSQGYLKCSGDSIVNENNRAVILRGFGLGGWLLQEGYMFNTSSFANQQYKLQQHIGALVGNYNMQEFYKNWRDNFIKKRDIDTMAVWGFNSVRLPMHYNLFRNCFSQNFADDEGFRIIDSLIKWCRPHKMYVILDLHAAPGGQGNDLGISDRDDTKPSLWQSQANRDTMVAIWKNIATKYVNEPIIGGYDILNEPNWTLTNNADLLNLYQRITTEIRKIDKNHIIIIEGNWFANDFTGLFPPWDNNMVYSFHKYWNATDQGSIQWVLNLRNQYKVPLWCGEFGENSNAWFANAVYLFEKNKIGWSNWPWKKYNSMNSPFSIKTNKGWERLLGYWTGKLTKPTQEEALACLREMIANLSVDSCIYRPDLFDAYIRQPRDTSLKAFGQNKIPGTIFAPNYDLGMFNKAYYDKVFQTLSLSPWVNWNNGYAYRNDGVDIDICTDTAKYTNGYCVGWIEKGEWLRYTVNVENTGIYDFTARVSSESQNGAFHVEIDGKDASGTIYVPFTESYKKWKSVAVKDIYLTAGKHIMTIRFDSDDFNLSSLTWIKNNSQTEVPFKVLAARSDTLVGFNIKLSFNKKLKTPVNISVNDFKVESDWTEVPVTSLKTDEKDPSVLILTLQKEFTSSGYVTISYNGSSIISEDNKILPKFDNLKLVNYLPRRLYVPGKLKAEKFSVNSGFSFEPCTDTDGGQNAGYTDQGDYLDFYVNVTTAGVYKCNFRISGNGGKGELSVIENGVKTVLATITIPATGAWQTWQTVSADVFINKGSKTLRFTALSSGFNLNYIETSVLSTGLNNPEKKNEFRIIPNPNNGNFKIDYSSENKSDIKLEILNIEGKKIIETNYNATNYLSETFSTNNLKQGIYFVKITTRDIVTTQKMIIYAN